MGRTTTSAATLHGACVWSGCARSAIDLPTLYLQRQWLTPTHTWARRALLNQAYHLRALGGEAWAYPLFKRGEAVGASFADWRWYCNSARAHRLAEWAVREHGGAAAHRLASALFEAAYEQGANLSEPEALLEAAKAAGLDADAAETVVRSQRYSNEVRDSQRTFESLPPASGAEGRLPFYIVAAGSGEGGDVSGAAAAVLGGEAARMGGGAGALSLGGAQEVETWMDAFDRAVMLGNR